MLTSKLLLILKSAYSLSWLWTVFGKARLCLPCVVTTACITVAGCSKWSRVLVDISQLVSVVFFTNSTHMVFIKTFFTLVSLFPMQTTCPFHFHYLCICSALSGNLCFLQIAQRFLQIVQHFLGIPRWRSAFWKVMIESRNLLATKAGRYRKYNTGISWQYRGIPV